MSKHNKIIKFILIFAICILVSCGFLNSFFEANKTKVIVNYIASQERGYLQLFYKKGEPEYSEDRSIHCQITANGKSEFLLPKMNISELRLDTDGISVLRIRSIEIAQIGYKQIINSENWADYYKSQYGVESLFDDESLISYKTTGDDPMVIFETGISNYVIQGCIQYGVLLVILAAGCFAAVILVAKYIEKKGALKQENIYVFVKYICAGLIFIYAFIIDVDVIKMINEREQIEYMVFIDNAEFVEKAEDITERFTVHGKSLLAQQFMVEKSDVWKGTINYQIKDKDSNVIIDATEPLENLTKSYDSKWDIISIDCEALNLRFGQEYDICMKIESENPVRFVMNSRGEMQQRQIMKFVHGNLYISIVIFISIVMLGALFMILKHDFSPNLFLIVALLLGIMACFILTPCTVDDEYRHFLRVYDIVSEEAEAYNSFDLAGAKGNVLADPDYGAPLIEVPYELGGLRLADVNFNYDDISNNAEKNLQACPDEVMRLLLETDSDETSIVSIVATNSVTIWSYIPQVLAAFLGKLFGMNAVGIYYMARIGNMLFSIFIVYICMRMLPEYRNIFIFVYFAPNAFWLSASCNRDSVATSLAMLCVSYIIYIKDNKKIMSIKRIILLSVLFGFLAIVKLPYVLLIAMLLMLKTDNYAYITGKWSKNFVKVGIAVAIFVIGLGSYIISVNYESIKTEIGEEKETPVIAEVPETEMTHISYALSYPTRVIGVIWDRYKTIISEDIPGAFNGFSYQLGMGYVWIALAIILCSKKVLKWHERIYVLLIYLTIWLAILVVGFTWQAPDLGYIWGISPRYMIPILPLLAMVICSGNDKTGRVANTLAPMAAIGLAAMDMVSMIPVYY